MFYYSYAQYIAYNTKITKITSKNYLDVLRYAIIYNNTEIISHITNSYSHQYTSIVAVYYMFKYNINLIKSVNYTKISNIYSTTLANPKYVKCLLELGQIPKLIDLYYAICCNEAESVLYYIEIGNLIPDCRAIVYAVILGYTDIVKYLLFFNIPINLTNIRPLCRTPDTMHCTYLNKTSNFKSPNRKNIHPLATKLVHLAAQFGHLDIVKLLPIDSVVLEIAATYNHVDIVKYVINNIPFIYNITDNLCKKYILIELNTFNLNYDLLLFAAIRNKDIDTIKYICTHTDTKLSTLAINYMFYCGLIPSPPWKSFIFLQLTLKQFT